MVNLNFGRMAESTKGDFQVLRTALVLDRGRKKKFSKKGNLCRTGTLVQVQNGLCVGRVLLSVLAKIIPLPSPLCFAGGRGQSYVLTMQCSTAPQGHMWNQISCAALTFYANTQQLNFCREVEEWSTESSWRRLWKRWRWETSSPGSSESITTNSSMSTSASAWPRCDRVFRGSSKQAPFWYCWALTSA